MKTVSASEMREIDRRTIEEAGIYGDLLMERAGHGVAEIALDLLDARIGHTILLIAGTGNNGGDVFAAATFLAAADVDIVVWICGAKKRIKGDAEYHLKKMIRAGITPKEISTPKDLNLEWSPAIIVDGLLGTGAKGAPRGFMNDTIEFINREAHHSYILSIDLPSGLDADTGTAEGIAVKANLTATLALPKTGLIRPEALPYAGSIEVIDIGIPEIYGNEIPGCQEAELIDRMNLTIPYRDNTSHKGHHGHVLLIGGSIGYTGAIAMAARAALRSGAGLVSVLTPEEVSPIVAQAAGPEVMVHPLPSLEQIPTIFSEKWNKVDAILIGPGLPKIPPVIEALLNSCKIPLVLDAGALCINPSVLSAAKCPIVITPHPGEFKRLFGETGKDRWEQAREASDQIGQTIVLKGAGTVVAHPKYKLGINMTGNPGMATAGSGDVLAGILVALLGQGLAPFEASTTAVHLHGLAGDLTAETITQEALIATDLIDSLPSAIRLIKFS
jgi:ADP-dependent NAD(P)H-hydrate dehydratase / NAD(P)H-hydrate epimerase